MRKLKNTQKTNFIMQNCLKNIKGIINKRAKMAMYRSADCQINWPLVSGEEVQNRVPR